MAQGETVQDVDKARVRYLTVDEAERLVNACDSNFRPVVQGALQTGAPYGQLAQLAVSDFNLDVGTVRVRTRKGDGNEKEYHITLTDEGSEFFRVMCAGRQGDELIFLNTGRDRRKSEQTRPMAEAIGRAKIKPPIGWAQQTTSSTALDRCDGTVQNASTDSAQD
jgi:integrase